LLRDIIRNTGKDFRIEFRSRYALNISLAFAGISTLAISLSAGGVKFPVKVQAIMLWVIMFFSAMNGLLHIFIREEEEQTALFLRLNMPGDSIYLSKLIFNIIFFMAIQVVVCPLYVFFLQVEVGDIIMFTLSVFSGGLAISSATTILAAMVARAGGKGSLFTVISFPLLLPVIWVGISSTAASFEGATGNEKSSIIFLLAFSGAITAISFLLFRFVWYEE